MNILSEVDALKGVGAKRKELLAKLGIVTIRDLLEYFPVTYDEMTPPVPVDKIPNGTKGRVRVRILGVSRSRNVVMAKVTDGVHDFTMKWFHMPYLKSVLKAGAGYIAEGTVRRLKTTWEIIQPKLYQPEEYEALEGRILPVYGLTKGLSNHVITNTMETAFETLTEIPDILSPELRKEYELSHYDYCLRQMHFPDSKRDLMLARKRLVFQEFYTFLYKIRKMRENREELKTDVIIHPHQDVSEVEKAMGFSLTGAQKRALEEIRHSMASGIQMSRLLQGDVGSGKTVVAFLAMLDTVKSGRQAVMMAPTEILARQHRDGLVRLLEMLGIDEEPVLLTSSLKGKKREEAYAMIADGRAQFIIGTHALFWKDVEYFNPGLVVTDEQHRFGVYQRSSLANKGERPHILVMSATPIPRTLAVILYGDLELSVIDELPKHRIPIKNKVVGPEYEAAAYKLIRQEVEAGRQAYVVCPLIEPSEGVECVDVMTETKRLQTHFGKGIRVEYLHGRMRAEEKNSVMERFAAREIDVLVSTTVIEVGVDVPNATVMVIVDPQFFGLAQLHQLRGRVGRGGFQSYCVYLVIHGNPGNNERLQILEKSNDGFVIANEDLRLRGPGEFFGIRQSGEMDFQLADLYTDAELLKVVSQAMETYGDAGLNITDGFALDTI